MDTLFELGGHWLARAYAFYGIVILALPFTTFANIPILAAAVWAARAHARGRRPWPWIPPGVRRWGRLALEVTFGLINPVLYLVVLTAALPGLQPHTEWWTAPFTAAAWLLLAAFWSLRIFGTMLDPRSPIVRTGVRMVLLAALACLALYVIKDLRAVPWTTTTTDRTALNLLRVCPFYLVPAVLLWDHLRSVSRPSGSDSESRHGLFLLPGRAARLATAAIAGLATVTFVATTYRRSDAAVQRLVGDHRDSIRAAADRYDVDPRLIASIVYVTHRDQLSPFREELERILVNAWAHNLRRDMGMGPPDRVDEIGTDESPLLNRALDISVGLAQIKPRTAQTASVLATGRTPDDLPRPVAFSYRDVEPLGNAWKRATVRPAVADIPVPAEREVVARVLLDAPSNLATCALILSLYQTQWEATNGDWSLRGRPDILATLYQIGFARSKPHGAPRANAFGARVGQVYEEPWVGALFGTAPRTS
jgi:hypothetical protein